MARKQETNYTDEIRALKAQLGAGQFAPVYLVMGEQDYLRTQNRDLIRNALLAGGDAMNSAYYTGDHFTIQEIKDLAETLPFLAERRVITIENSWLFGKNAADTDALTDYLEHMPETTHLILVDSKVDKTRRLYKAIKKRGYVLDCATPDAGQLRLWVAGKAREAGMSITSGAADLLISYNESDLLLIKNDIDKLAAYCMGRPGITEDDVRQMCTRQIGDWVFDLISAISTHQTDRALHLYLDLLQRQTPPQVILALLIRNYNQLLQVSELAGKGLSSDEIASMLHANPWAMRNRILPEATGHSAQEMRMALQDCIQMDQDYKAGRIGDQLGIETLIVRRAAQVS